MEDREIAGIFGSIRDFQGSRDKHKPLIRRRWKFTNPWTKSSLVGSFIPGFVEVDVVNAYPNRMTFEVRGGEVPSLSQLGSRGSGWLLTALNSTFLSRGSWRDVECLPASFYQGLPGVEFPPGLGLV